MKQVKSGPNFVLLAAGQAASLLGNSVLDLALSMFVLERTGSAGVYGSMLAGAMVPAVLLAPLGGVVADRANRQRMMVLLDVLSGIAVLLTVPFLKGAQGIGAAAVLMMVLSILGAVETPVVQAALPQAVPCGALEQANAAVLQIGMLSSMVGPVLGGVLYRWFGTASLLLLCGGCFLITAGFECLIHLEPVAQPVKGDGVLQTVWLDLKASGRFLRRRQPALLGLLGLVAMLGVLCNGVAGVGAPYLICTRLGLDAGWYGAAGSALGAFGVAGSLAAGVLAGRLRLSRLAGAFEVMGACLLGAGTAFLLSGRIGVRYGVLVAALCGMQLCAVIFSVFARSVMQRRIPVHLIGKVMALAMALETCGQPMGQLVYGFLFDRYPAGGILLVTGLLLLALGLAGQKLLNMLDAQGAGELSDKTT